MKHLEQLDHSSAGDKRWQLSCLAAQLLAAAPPAIGGLSVRASQGPVLDAWLTNVSKLFADCPVIRLPPHISDERLVGGLDLTETLRNGGPRYTASVLTRADRGLVVIPAADRLDDRKAALIAACIDSGGLSTPKGSSSSWQPARFNVIALDESLPDEDGLAASLSDRLAFRVSLDGVSLRDIAAIDCIPDHAGACDYRDGNLAAITSQDLEALCLLCDRLGIQSQRALILAGQAAQLHAGLNGRSNVIGDDLMAAAQLVLSGRATRLPIEPSHEADSSSEEPPAYTDDEPEPALSESNHSMEKQIERLVQTAQANLPPNLLAALQPTARRSSARAPGKSGIHQNNHQRGARIGVRRGKPERGARLALHATLLAAAPFQRLRRAVATTRASRRQKGLIVLPDDLRIYRRRQKSETLTVFAVDASGSSALHRLAEAKGAVELLLADCYIRRDQVAMIAFRRTSADIVLPPTSAVARARRCLATLPGGGGTPLANAMDTGLQLAQAARLRGAEPYFVLLTDGRANIDRGGNPGRQQAMSDAFQTADMFRKDGLQSLLIDTAPRTSPQAGELARAMQAHYFALPKADANVIRRAVQSFRP